MPETQTDPYAEFQDAKPASQGTSSASVSSSDPYAEFQEPKSKVAEPTGEHDPNARFFAGTKPAELSAGKTGVGPWLENAENDLRYGGESTWLGKAAHAVGMPGIRRGVSEQTGDLIGGVVEAPIHAAQAAHELVTGHPIKAVNKAAQTLGDVALPATVVAPELLPLMAPRIGGAIVGSKAAGKLAPHLTDDPDKQELISNVGGAVGAGSPEILEHSTAPIVRGGAKTYNAVRGAAETVAPVAGVLGAAERLYHGDPHGAVYSLAGGGFLNHALSKIKEAPESLTRYGLEPEAGPIVRSTAKPAAAPKPGFTPMVLPEPASELNAINSAAESAKPTVEPLKPLGSTAEPVAEEPAAVRQARHTVGSAAVDRLKGVEGGPEVLQRLHNGTYQNYADVANTLEIPKPQYLKARNGDAWQASEFNRSVREHGKELSGPKETVIRELLSKPPAEILQYTKPWIDNTAQYPKKMSSLTERTMKALNLSEEAKNDMRASGVDDKTAQSLLAKLTHRQLDNLS